MSQNSIKQSGGKYYERTETGWVERRRSLSPAEILFDAGVIDARQLQAANMYHAEYWSSTMRPRYVLTNSNQITIDAPSGKPDYDPIGNEHADASMEQIENHLGRRHSDILEQWAGIQHDWTFEGVDRKFLAQSALVRDFLLALRGLVSYYSI